MRSASDRLKPADALFDHSELRMACADRESILFLCDDEEASIGVACAYILRRRLTTLPTIDTSSTMIGSMVLFSGWRRK